MAKPDDQEQDDTVEAKAAPAKKSCFGSIKKKWVIRILAASVLIHTLGFAFYWTYYPNPRWNKLGREESLGTFEFKNRLTEGIVIKRAVFDVHVSLLEGMELKARILLESRALKIEQEIEQLLRLAKQADFEDPLLAELKRQVQEIINGILGARVIEEILITDLVLYKPQKVVTAVSTPANETAPEPPSAGLISSQPKAADSSLAVGKATPGWSSGDPPK